MPILEYKIPALGGLNLSVPPNLLQRHYLQTAEGVWNRDNMVVRMPGLVTLNTDSPGTIAFLFEFLPSNGDRYLIAYGGGVVQYFDTSTSQFVDVTGALSLSGITYLSAEQFFDGSSNEIIILTTGNDLIKWTGTGNFADLGGTPPDLCYLNAYEHYLLGILKSNRRRVRYSALANGESWPAANYFDLRRTGSLILTMKNMSGRCAIYKTDSISMVDFVGGGLVFDLTEDYIKGVGVASPESVIPFGDRGDKHAFISGDGNAYVFDGIDAQPIGDPIRPILASLTDTQLASIHGGYLPIERKIIWGISSVGLLAYDIRDGSWWRKNFALSRCGSFERVRDDTHKKDFFFYQSDYLMRWQDENEDPDDTNGLYVSGSFITPFDNLDGNDGRLKMLTSIWVETNYYNRGNIKLIIFTDNNLYAYNEIKEGVGLANEDMYALIDLQGEPTDEDFPTPPSRIVHQIDTCIVGFNFAFYIVNDDVSYDPYIPFEFRIIAVEYEDIGERSYKPQVISWGGEGGLPAWE